MTTGGFDLGGLDIGALLAQAQSVQNQLEAAQNQLAESNFEGTAGGGLVRATVTGTGELDALTICLLYTSPSPRDQRGSRMPSSA